MPTYFFDEEQGLVPNEMSTKNVHLILTKRIVAFGCLFGAGLLMFSIVYFFLISHSSCYQWLL